MDSTSTQQHGPLAEGVTKLLCLGYAPDPTDCWAHVRAMEVLHAPEWGWEYSKKVREPRENILNIFHVKTVLLIARISKLLWQTFAVKG